MFYIGLYRETHEKIVLSEAIKSGALVCSILVDFHQVCSNYATGAKISLTPGDTRDMASFQQIPIVKL